MSITVTLTVTLPENVAAQDSARIATALRAQAQRLVSPRGSRTEVSLSGRPYGALAAVGSAAAPQPGVNPTPRTSRAPLPPGVGLVIDVLSRRVQVDGLDVDLTYKEFELLAHLVRHAHTTISRADLMGSVWADAPEGTGERTVDVHVRRLRSKLGSYQRVLSTVRGQGYRLDPDTRTHLLGV